MIDLALKFARNGAHHGLCSPCGKCSPCGTYFNRRSLLDACLDACEETTLPMPLSSENKLLWSSPISTRLLSHTAVASKMLDMFS